MDSVKLIENCLNDAWDAVNDEFMTIEELAELIVDKLYPTCPYCGDEDNQEMLEESFLCHFCGKKHKNVV